MTSIFSTAAGLSNNASYQSNRNSNQTYKNAWNALSSGYGNLASHLKKISSDKSLPTKGFGAFFFFAAFAVSLSAAFHISPLVAG